MSTSTFINDDCYILCKSPKKDFKITTTKWWYKNNTDNSTKPPL